MAKKIKFNIGDRVIQFTIGEFEEEMDIDKLLKIDYSNILAEILTFPVIVNRFGLMAAEMDNIVQETKLNLAIFEAKTKEQIREELNEENGKRPTIAEVDDRFIQNKKYQVKQKLYYKVIKEKEYIYSIYQSAKDKSYKLDKLSLSLRPDDLDEKTIQKQLNNVYYQIQKGRISE